jgi:hypothetical protein
MSSCSASLLRLRVAELGDVGPEALVAQPEAKHVRHASTGDRRSGQPVDAIRVLVGRACDAFFDLDLDVPALVVGAAADPLCLPVRVLDLSTESGRLVVSNIGSSGLDGVSIDLDEAGQPVAAGVYFYRRQAGSFSATRRMVLVR